MKVIICGAGDAGNTMLREMQRNRALGYIPVGIIDDDELWLGTYYDDADTDEFSDARAEDAAGAARDFESDMTWP